MTRNEQIDIASLDWWMNKVNQNGDAEMAFKAGAAWADAHPHWISVEDALPEYNQKVLWCWDDGLISMGRIGRVALDERHTEDGYITHWMPIPQPPKKGSEQ